MDIELNGMTKVKKFVCEPCGKMQICWRSVQFDLITSFLTSYKTILNTPLYTTKANLQDPNSYNSKKKVSVCTASLLMTQYSNQAWPYPSLAYIPISLNTPAPRLQ